jgi:hypothetical protein
MTFTKHLSKELRFCLSWLILTHTSSSTWVVSQTKVVCQATFFPSKQDVYQVGLIPKRTYAEVPLYIYNSKSFFISSTDGIAWFVASSQLRVTIILAVRCPGVFLSRVFAREQHPVPLLILLLSSVHWGQELGAEKREERNVNFFVKSCASYGAVRATCKWHLPHVSATALTELRFAIIFDGSQALMFVPWIFLYAFLCCLSR